MRPILFSKSLLPLFHARSIISGQINDPFVAGNILESLLLADHTNLSKGRALLSFCAHRSTFMYNTLLHAYVSNKLPSLALLLFDEMLHLDITPNNHTFPLLLKAMGQTCQLKNGASLHSMILKYGFSSDQFVRASLIHFYGSLGAIVDAFHVFRENSEPSVSSWTALLTAYVKNGNLISAREVFDEMPERNLVSWSAMISGYVQFRQPGSALVLFQEMMGMKVQPSHSILVSILVAVAELGALQEGKWVHGFLERSQIYLSSNLKTSLVHMYAKCGDLMSAKQTFETLRERNVDLWNAMIAGLGLYGRGEEALELFADMVDEGIQPDDMTFICLLSAYSHSGMVAEGHKCFESMRKVYKIDPKVEHYSCMVDLLAKAGLFMEAVEFIQKMPMEPNDRIWGSLFGACRIHGDIGSGEAIGKHLIEMEPHEPGCYILFANLYASTGRWKDALTVRRTMKIRGVELEPGCSLIEVDGMVHEFLVGDRGHPSSNDIYDMLDKMAKIFDV
ncbi:pentatricopeptide repeat-containing protein At5g48910-like [Dendrobium catenatum]|uniref:Pentatricopeptide repeat-containing protein n=1 Tax=Dendrobium catenatum TaxID=906689 RepID=A0A2I0V8J8_9ASPA|nr:pentatricopeptide repeat-containing protein At5g48910-like [Dendrobium catenatum]PKU59727.1 Pentatricopeptide repeat-containing protein [Dendrobium catenatum]